MKTMFEYAAFLGTFVILMIISLFCIYNVFQGLLEMIREFLEEINDERINGNVNVEEEKDQKHCCSGQITGRAELQRSNGRDAEKEESGKWQTKKS